MLSRMKSILSQRNFTLFKRPYELNIVGIRSKNIKSNSFDDEIHVFYKMPSGIWNYHIYKATTDPGTFWLKKPEAPQGTAILAQGQYLSSYQIGLHKGKYKALVQRKPVTVIRDYNRDAVLDFMNGQKQNGEFGINIHKASYKGDKKTIDRDSAGCQVLESQKDYDEFIKLCERHNQLYGNHFTYTLIDFRAIRRENLKRIILGGVTLGLGIIGYIEYNHD